MFSFLRNHFNVQIEGQVTDGDSQCLLSWWWPTYIVRRYSVQETVNFQYPCQWPSSCTLCWSFEKQCCCVGATYFLLAVEGLLCGAFWRMARVGRKSYLTFWLFTSETPKISETANTSCTQLLVGRSSELQSNLSLLLLAVSAHRYKVQYRSCIWSETS